MIKYIVLTISMVFITASAYALDVSVVNDRAQAGVTINSLVSKVDLLSAAVKTQSELLTDANIKITKMQTCASVDMIYDVTAITNVNPSGCVAIPIDPNQLANVLTCEDGEIIKMVDGALDCTKDSLTQCKICEDFAVYTRVETVTGFMQPTCLPLSIATTETLDSPVNIVETVCTAIPDTNANGNDVLSGGLSLNSPLVGSAVAISSPTFSGYYDMNGSCNEDADDYARALGFPVISASAEKIKNIRTTKIKKPLYKKLHCN